MLKNKQLFASLILLLAITQNSSAQENTQPADNTETPRHIADKVEKDILNRYVFVDAKEFAEKTTENKPLSIQLMDYLEKNEALKKLKNESPEEIGRLKFRISQNMQSAHLQAEEEYHKKQTQTSSLWYTHLAHSTALIPMGVAFVIIFIGASGKHDPHWSRGLAITATGIAASTGIYYSHDRYVGNQGNDKTKINELAVMKNIVDYQLYPIRPKKTGMFR